MLIAERFGKRYAQRLGERLVEDGTISDSDLVRALERQKVSGDRLGEALVAMGLVGADRLKPYLEEITGFPFVDVSEIEIDPMLSALIPESVAVSRCVLAFEEDGAAVRIAMADPLDIAAVDDLKARLARPVRPCLALTTDLKDAIQRAYDGRSKARSMLDEIVETAVVDDHAEILTESADTAPIVRLLNNVLTGAFTAEASDIHIEPRIDGVYVRYRIDGLLYDQMTIPSSHLPATISRLKVMSGLDIAENRRPQDGRFTARDEHGREYDVRLSVIPTVHGQKACLRLLEKSAAIPTLENLGFLPAQREVFESMLRRPYGLILVTGPTGSGKTTSLYSGLAYVADSTKNINTIEDPVEYALPIANQMQVNPKIGLTFAAGLRSLLRQDPDIILIGEIRDRETAEIAIQAAMTGHLVLSTLHTNDAPSALVRLQNMGIEPYLISSAVTGVIGQRLLRRICPHCAEEYVAPNETLRAIGYSTDHGRVLTLMRGRGCRRCGGRGMRGRSAAYEVLLVSDQLREMMVQGATGPELVARARAEGLQTMRESALKKVLDGTTTPEELVRVFAQGE